MEDNVQLYRAIISFALIQGLILLAAAICTLEQAQY